MATHIASKKRLNRVDTSTQTCLTPTDMGNCSDILPLDLTAAAVFSCKALTMVRNFGGR